METAHVQLLLMENRQDEAEQTARVRVWSAILQQIRLNQRIDRRYAEAVEKMIRCLQEESASARQAEQTADEGTISHSDRMDYEIELLQAITDLSSGAASGQTGPAVVVMSQDSGA